MAKRIYVESVKKWAKGLGISGGTLAGLIFMYLFAVGAISNVSYSGDVVCAGTQDDPCYAFINFTAEEDIFIYPTGYDPWGRNTLFNFDPNVKSWRMERSWGDGWREIPLNKTCAGSWCGASNSGDVSYSYAFREDRDYRIRLTAYKNDPTESIKWGAFSGVDEIDPVWIGVEKKKIDKKQSSEIIFQSPRVLMWNITSQEYLGQYVNVTIERINDTDSIFHFEVEKELKEEIEKCKDDSCLKKIKDKYLEISEDSIKATDDIKKLDKYPIKTISGNITLDKTEINAIDGDSIHVKTDGVVGDKLEFGFGTITAEIINTTGGYGELGQIRLDSNGIPHIVHQPYALAQNRPQLQYCNRTGGSWNCEDIINESIGVRDRLDFEIDSNDKIHVAYWSYGDIIHQPSYCNNTLGFWSCTNITTNYSTYDYISVNIDTNDNPIITFTDPDADVQYCNKTAGVWNCEEVYNATEILNTDSIINSSNCLHIAGVGNDDLMYGLKCPGEDWLWEVAYNGYNSDGYPIISLDTTGQPGIMFWDFQTDYPRYCKKNTGSWVCDAIILSPTVERVVTGQQITESGIRGTFYDSDADYMSLIYTPEWEGVDTLWYNSIIETESSFTNIAAYYTKNSMAVKKGRLSTSTSYSNDLHIIFEERDGDTLRYINASGCAGDCWEPTWSGNTTNATAAGEVSLHSVDWVDAFNLSGFIFSWDNGVGTFTNDSWVSLSGISDTSEAVKTINGTPGQTIRWQVHANDSSDLWTSTDIFSYENDPPPTIDKRELYPASPYSSDDLTLNITCTDGEDSTIIAHWNIYKDDVNQTSLAGSLSISNATETEVYSIGSGNTSYAEEWYATVWCVDQNDGSSDLLDTSTRTINALFPQFTDYVDNEGAFETTGTALFNVTVTQTNGTVLLEVDGSNYSATNPAGDIYSASATLTTGSYDYKWYSYGSGPDENENVSATNNYIVNPAKTLDITDPTTGSPVSVTAGDNITIVFNYTEDGSEISTGVTMNNVTIGGLEATILQVGVASQLTLINYEDFEGHSELYEGDFTYWLQATFDDDAWGAYTGNGQSSGTGPTANYDGYYAMVETSSGQCNNPDTAVIYNSPEIDFDTYDSVNISFAYNMYGTTMGTLHIKENSTGSWLSVWNKSGNLGTAWFEENKEITGLTGSGNLAIWLDCGNSYTSDAAVDSVNVTGIAGGISDDFAFIAGSGWQVNVTVPSGTGLEDLFVDAIYSGDSINNTESNAVNYGGADTCSCPGSGNNWEVDMTDMCTLSTPCNLGTGNLSWIGASGYFNCSSQLNLTNRNAPISNTIFYYSTNCEVNRL